MRTINTIPSSLERDKSHKVIKQLNVSLQVLQSMANPSIPLVWQTQTKIINHYKYLNILK